MINVNKYLTFAVITLICAFPSKLYSQEQITINFKFHDAGQQYEKVFIPGSFNDWGPNANGQIAVDAPSLMTYNQQNGYWEKEVTLNTGESFQYKFHVHKNSDGSNFEWFTDPLNDQSTGSPDFNSIVRTSDPMFFQLRKGLNQQNQVFFNASIASNSPVTSVNLDISGLITEIGNSFNESTLQIDYQSDTPCEDITIYRLIVENESGELATELITCGEGSFVPDWAKDAVWYQIFPERFRNGDPSNDPVRSSLEAPQFNNAPENWAITPWHSDWYDRADWELGEGGNFYNNGVFLRRYGGDLQGVIDQLDYLSELGINAIYFNPVFWGPSLHKFDVASYHHIDPHFGPDPESDKAIIATENENPDTWKWTSADLLFLQLLTKAKEKNIKIIIDGVFNHSGRAFFAFQDLLANQENSSYADWYDVISFDDPNTTANEFSYNSFFGFESLPEFANENGESTLVAPVRTYLFNITKRWMDPNGDGDPSDGVDGWRLDASALVPDGFWAEWNNYVRTINPDAYTTLEEFGPASDLIEKGFFSAAMNYQGFTFPIQGYFIIGESSSLQFWQRITQQFDQFGEDTRFVMQNLTNSHDTERLGSMLVNNSSNGITANPLSKSDYLVRKPNEEERNRQKLTALFQIGFQGAPMFYYGTESGMWGATDPDDRMPMNWSDIDFDLQDNHPFGMNRPADDINFDQGLFNYYKNIINIRHQYEATRRGDLELVSAGNILIFKRVLNGEEVYFAINNQNLSDDSQIIDPSGALEPVFYTQGNPNDLSIHFLDGVHSFELPAYAGVVFAAKGSLTFNQVPIIAGLNTSINSDEDNSFTLEKSQFDITDQDDDVSALQLTVIEGRNYQVNGNEVTPDLNFNGELSVKIQVSDGKDKSEIIRTNVMINPINDKPVLEGARSDLMVTAGETITLLPEQFLFSDPDNQSLLDFTVVAAGGDNYSINGSEITPESAFTGTLVVPVKISDGIAESNEITVPIIVNKVTDVSDNISPESVTLFPVPARELISVQINNQYSGHVKFTILDQTGRQVKTTISVKNMREMKETFNIQELVQGVYYLELEVEGFAVRKRFIK